MVVLVEDRLSTARVLRNLGYKWLEKGTLKWDGTIRFDVDASASMLKKMGSGN